jgi:hypothetical protein
MHHHAQLLGEMGPCELFAQLSLIHDPFNLHLLSS